MASVVSSFGYDDGILLEGLDWSSMDISELSAKDYFNEDILSSFDFYSMPIESLEPRENAGILDYFHPEGLDEPLCWDQQLQNKSPGANLKVDFIPDSILLVLLTISYICFEIQFRVLE